MKIPISIQWHITTNCTNRCKHCYMFDSATFESEQQNPLSLDDIKKIATDLCGFEAKYNAYIGNIILSGGDPLLRKDWPEIVRLLKSQNRHVGIMGNPDTLTEYSVKKLADLGIANFQMSLDGLKTTHDFFRHPGSFNLTVKKLKLLRKYGIKCNIMFTLYPENAPELIPLLRFVAFETEATSFSFDLGCAVGNGKNLLSQFSVADLYQLFKDYHHEKESIKQLKPNFHVVEKSKLHNLIHYEQDQFYPVSSQNGASIYGCFVGWSSLAILTDGTVLGCRRLPISIGKLPSQSFEEIFLGSALLKKFRRQEFFQGCGKCGFYAVCRGCPSQVCSVTGDPFAKNELCFKDYLSKPVKSPATPRLLINMASSYQEEWNLIKARYIFLEKDKSFLLQKKFRDFFAVLYHNQVEKKQFLSDPKNYLKLQSIKLTKEQIDWLIYFFSSRISSLRYDATQIVPNTQFVRSDVIDPDTISIDGLALPAVFTGREILHQFNYLEWANVKAFLIKFLADARIFVKKF